MNSDLYDLPSVPATVSLTDNEINQSSLLSFPLTSLVILDGEEWLLSRSASTDDEEIPDVQHSGCAWSVSYRVGFALSIDPQNKKQRNEDRVYLNSCVAFDLQTSPQDASERSPELCASSSGLETSDHRFQWCTYQKGSGKALFAMWGRRWPAR